MSFLFRTSPLTTIRSQLSLLRARTKKQISPQAAQKLAQKQKTKTPKKAVQAPAESRYEIMKQILYQAPKTEMPPMTEEELERHEIIERAWKLLMRNRREARERELQAKFRKMKQANRELERTSLTLFKAAQSMQPNTRFPKQMKIPTETPPLSGWNYDYTPPEAPESKQELSTS